MQYQVREEELKQLRFFAGFILAPVAPAVPLLVYHVFMHFLTSRKLHVFLDITPAVFFAIILSCIGYLAAFFIGLPTLIYAYGRGARSLRAYSLGGCAIGAVPGPLICLVLNDAPAWFFAATMIAGALYGALAGVVFWFIVVREYGNATAIES